MAISGAAAALYVHRPTTLHRLWVALMARRVALSQVYSLDIRDLQFALFTDFHGKKA